MKNKLEINSVKHSKQYVHNGSEISNFSDIEKNTDTKIYLIHHYSSF
ncbi:MAG: hypothetical protein MR510_15130 [Clostridium sp.]|nr:hypothetical protein [uncultured Clostridium sp.]MCI6693778.1 hypothetical protein [Clostridium sp.]